MLIRSMQRAAVNIYKAGSSYKMLVLAPGRIKEHFSINVDGNELRLSYTPPEGFPVPNGYHGNTAGVVLQECLRLTIASTPPTLPPATRMVCYI